MNKKNIVDNDADSSDDEAKEKNKEKDETKKKDSDIYLKLNAYKPLSSKAKKHNCSDCFNCLFCSDARCAMCLSPEKNKSKDGEKLPKKENSDA